MFTLFAAVTALLTTWGSEITADNAWRLYPRPQMVRESWQCLNGMWDYSITTNNSALAVETQKGRILVPFAFEAPLSGVGRLIKADETMVYSRNFELSVKPGERVLLNFEAVDWRAHVFVNGIEAGLPHEGGNIPFSYDITKLVKNGTNSLTVYVWDPTHEFIVAGGKQNDRTYACFYTRVSGIWQTVWLEKVPSTYIKDYNVVPDIDKGEITFDFEVAGDEPYANVEVLVHNGPDVSQKVIKTAKTRAGRSVTVKMPEDFKLWSPDAPNLYAFTAKCGADKIEGYFAMRKFGKIKDANGHWRFALNNKEFFVLGTLDQGWWPDGLLTPPSEDAMIFDIMTLKNAGYNTMRKHIKVEPRRYYALCDKIGLVLMQDAPSPVGNMNNFDKKKNLQRYGMFRREWKEEIDLLKKVPSICVWVPYNEGWGQPDARRTADTLRWTKSYDPTRLVDGPSGWFDYEGGNPGKKDMAWLSKELENPSSDIVDHHIYRGPGQASNRVHRISLLGEFGGLGHPVKGHMMFDQKTWGYGGVADTSTKEGLQKAYTGLMDKLLPMIDVGLAGVIYTQTTDVEIEINGLLTYDRKVMKFDNDFLKREHRKVLDHAAKKR